MINYLKLISIQLWEREREKEDEKDCKEEEDGKDRERRISVQTMLEERTRQGEQEANLQKYKKI